MPTKYGDFKHLYFKDSNGNWHEIDNIPTVRFVYDNDCIKPITINEYNLEISFKSAKTLNRIKKMLKRSENCRNRRLRRAKRIKEQERRSMLKWRALHNDGN